MATMHHARLCNVLRAFVLGICVGLGAAVWAAPAAPTLTGPANNGVGVGNPVQFNWTSPSGVTVREIQISSNATFAAPLVADVNNLSADIYDSAAGALTAATQYWWQVRVTDNTGTSGWSAAWTFTTASATAPAAPTLTAPGNNAVNQTPPINFTWTSPTGVTTRTIWVSNKPDFSNLVINQNGLTADTYSGAVPPLENGVTYYWEVMVSNGTDNSPWSSVWTFANSTVLVAPTLNTPANNATNQGLPITVTWNASAGAATYDVQVASDNGFANIVASTTGDTNTNYAPGSALQGNTVYYWRVRAEDANGLGAWSGTWQFTTGDLINGNAPTLLDPANNSTKQSQTPTFDWNNVNNSLDYFFQYSTDSTMATGVTTYDTGNYYYYYYDEFVIPVTLKLNTTYYWRVRASMPGNAYTPWSAIWNFKTAELATPTLISPADGAVNVNQNSITFTWGQVTGATNYEILIRYSDTEVVVIDQQNLSMTSFTTTALLLDTSYDWTVRAFGANNYQSYWGSGWPTYATFTTIAPAAPVLVTPLNGAINVPLPPAPYWSDTAEMTEYELEVDTTGTFMTPLLDVINAIGVKPNLSTLVEGTKYYWRVRDIDTNVPTRTIESAFSSVWSFSTILTDVPPIPPTLTSPPNGTGNIGLPVTLQWVALDTPATGTLSYTVQVSTSISFATPLTLTNATNSVSATGLLASTRYFWRVAGIITTTGGLALQGDYSIFWSFNSASGGPGISSLIAPTYGATGVDITAPITFSWNAASAASTYDLQVGTDAALTAPIVDLSLLTDVSESVASLSASTLYYWQVRAENTSGAGAWSSTWYFTTGLAPLSPPTAVSPSDGTTGVTLPAILTWTSVATANEYRVQVSTTADFTSLVNTATLGIVQSLTVTGLAPDTVYYWRVAADSVTQESDWSTAVSFTTAVTTPGVPTLLTPLIGATNVATPPTLTWTSVPGATGYTLNIADDAAFTDIISTQNLTTTSYEADSLTGAVTYYWRVNAVNTAGTGLWSPIWSFTTAPGAGTPYLTSPLNGTTNLSQPVTVQWTVVTGITNYLLQVASDAGFTNIIYTDQPTVNSETLTTLTTVSTVYWRVCAVATGGPGYWSTIWRFSLQGLPNVPYLSTPGPSAVNVLVPLTLSWTAAVGATSYQVEVATDNGFGNIVKNVSGVAATSTSFTDLSLNTHYYWRVFATNAAGSTVSSIADFTTLAVPNVPLLTSPSNGATGQSLTPTLVWAAAARALAYEVQVSANADMSLPAVDTSATTTRYQVPTGALSGSGSTWYWRVQSHGVAGASASWSAVWSFVALTVPDQVTLLSPADGATGLVQPIRFMWNVAARATSYRIQTGTDPGFGAGTLLADNTVTATSNDISGFTAGETYYWHVIGINAAGNSTQWSAVQSFTPVSTVPGDVYLQSPVSGGTAPQPVTLLWTQPSGPPSSYWVQVSNNDATFSAANIVLNNPAVPTTGMTESLTLPSLIPTNRYYWRVRGVNAAGTGPWSSVWWFYTAASPSPVGTPPTVPTLLLPTDTATGVNTSPTLSWTASPDAANYWLQVATDDAYTNFVISTQALTVTNVTISQLSGNTTYYWRVAAGAGPLWSAFTTTQSFTTVAPPDPPTLVFPAAGATGITQPINFSWTAAARADSYILQVSPYPSFAMLTYNSSAVTGTSVLLTAPLSAATTYYWQVRSVNSAGDSTWASGSFTTN